MQRSPRMPRTANVFQKIADPINNFLKIDAASGILLILATMLALFLANSQWASHYEHFLHTPFKISIGSWALNMSFQHFVNDTLMAVFFFLIGMEIKREIVNGEISSFKKAALPIVAALGGMIVPALIYYSFNSEGPYTAGWGIPMATDIAFAVGIMSLLSRKVPFSLKIFVLTLAIVDDLGAISVIAIFYNQSFSVEFFTYACLTLMTIYVLYSSGIIKSWVYIALGLFTWYFIYKSGIHATAAGVVLGLLMPLDALYDRAQVSKKIKDLVNELDKGVTLTSNGEARISHLGEKTINQLHQYTLGARSALEKTISNIHSLVSYFIVPLFAFVNTGLVLDSVNFGEFFKEPVALGIILGLFVGKPLGIFLFSFIAVKIGIAKLPREITWGKIIIAGFIAGIGFTMALFINNLALGNSDVSTVSKLSILLASILASLAGLILLGLSDDVSKPNDKS